MVEGCDGESTDWGPERSDGRTAEKIEHIFGGKGVGPGYFNVGKIKGSECIVVNVEIAGRCGIKSVIRDAATAMVWA